MPLNRLNFVVYDFETGGLKPGWHEAVEIGAKVYGPNFEPIPEAEFVSLMKPLYPDRLDKKALEVNGRTVEELMAAPEQGAVWKKFVGWVGQYNVKGAGFGGLPIACGKNIRRFDHLFVDELNALHMPKKRDTKIFCNRIDIDLEDFLFHWHCHDDDLEKYAMDPVRDYYGLSRDGAHGALVDCRQTGAMIMRYLKFCKSLRFKKDESGETVSRFKGSFAGMAI